MTSSDSSSASSSTASSSSSSGSTLSLEDIGLTKAEAKAPIPVVKKKNSIIAKLAEEGQEITDADTFQRPDELLERLKERKATRAEMGVEDSEEGLVDPKMLLLESIVQRTKLEEELEVAESGAVDVGTYIAPEPKDGIPCADRPLELDDLYVNLADLPTSLTIEELRETPDYVIVLHNTDNEATFEVLGSLPWQYAKDPVVTQHVAPEDGNKEKSIAVERYDFWRMTLVGALRKVGLVVDQRFSVDGDEIFLLIWGPQGILEERAESINMRVRTRPGYDLAQFQADVPIEVDEEAEKDVKNVRKKMHEMRKDAKSFYVSLKRRVQQGGDMSAFLSEEFDRTDRWMFFHFDDAKRMFLIKNLIETHRDKGGAGIAMDRYLNEGKVLAYYPMHDPSLTKPLKEQWATPRKLFAAQPIDQVRAYFGEKLALYFAFLGFYTYWLAIPALLGLIVFIYGLAEGNQDTELTPIYCVVLAIWVTFFLEYWKRYEVSLAFKWDMLDFEEKEESMATYRGMDSYGFWADEHFIPLELNAYMELGVDPSLVPREIYASPGSTRRRTIIGYIFVGFCGLIAIGLALCALAFRAYLGEVIDGTNEPDFDPDQTRFGAILGGIVMGAIIAFSNTIFRIVATKLVTWENHRTNSDFESHLIVKIFVFQFVNSYANLIYLAFLKEEGIIKEIFGVEDKCYGGCLNELSYQLGSIMVTGQIIGQVSESVLPFIAGRIARYRERKYKPSEVERQAKLAVSSGTLDEYSEMVIQLGYVTLFAAAFPLGALLALLNNMIEIRSDANKFLALFKRAHYVGAEDIGPFYSIINIIGILAIISNAVIIAFVSTQLDAYYDGLSTASKWIVVILIEHFILIVKSFVAWAIKDIPSYVSASINRQQNVSKMTLEDARYRAAYGNWSNAPIATEPVKGKILPAEEMEKIHAKAVALAEEASNMASGSGSDSGSGSGSDSGSGSGSGSSSNSGSDSGSGSGSGSGSSSSSSS